MSDTQWVQYKNDPQGQKWKVNYGTEIQWFIESDPDRYMPFIFPKSEYVPCAPPEVWRDVTEECDGMECAPELIVHNGYVLKECAPELIVHKGYILKESRGYRLVKVQLWKQYDGRSEYKDQWAFIVEKKEYA